MAAAGGQDDQRLVGEVTQGGKLVFTSSRPWPSSNVTSSANAQRLGWLLLGPVAATAAVRR
jgi:hypothetical protein